MDRPAWQATVLGVTKSQTRLSNWAHTLSNVNPLQPCHLSCCHIRRRKLPGIHIRHSCTGKNRWLVLTQGKSWEMDKEWPSWRIFLRSTLPTAPLIITCMFLLEIQIPWLSWRQTEAEPQLGHLPFCVYKVLHVIQIQDWIETRTAKLLEFFIYFSVIDFLW